MTASHSASHLYGYALMQPGRCKDDLVEPQQELLLAGNVKITGGGCVRRVHSAVCWSDLFEKKHSTMVSFGSATTG